MKERLLFPLRGSRSLVTVNVFIRVLLLQRVVFPSSFLSSLKVQHQLYRCTLPAADFIPSDGRLSNLKQDTKGSTTALERARCDL